MSVLKEKCRQRAREKGMGGEGRECLKRSCQVDLPRWYAAYTNTAYQPTFLCFVCVAVHRYESFPSSGCKSIATYGTGHPNHATFCVTSRIPPETASKGKKLPGIVFASFSSEPRIENHLSQRAISLTGISVIAISN